MESPPDIYRARYHGRPEERRPFRDEIATANPDDLPKLRIYEKNWSGAKIQSNAADRSLLIAA
jgi:hypothetical protein